MFSLQLDESSLAGNEAILLAYVRFIKEEDLAQEFLFARELVMDSKGKSIFQVVEGYFKEKEIPLANVISVATDGAPSMVGCQRGFISYLKKVVPNVLAIRCVIHLSPSSSFQLVITAVNRIKSRPLSHRLFRQLCEENGEDFHRLLLHTEVRWLSRGTCLSRFYNLYASVLEFFEKEDASLCANLKKFAGDIAYMADLYTKFNEMNLHLQGDDLNLIKTKSVISVRYFKNNLARGEFSNFPNLCELRRKGRINEQNVEVYWHHLELHHQDFIERLEDILSLEVPDWMTNPLSGVENAELQLQEELLELQANEELKPKFNLGYRAFWLQRVIPHLYPGLWNVVRKLLISFPSSYLAERGFIVVADLLTKKRNKLQIVNRGDLRLRLTSIEPDIEKLLSLRAMTLNLEWYFANITDEESAAAILREKGVFHRERSCISCHQQMQLGIRRPNGSAQLPKPVELTEAHRPDPGVER
ncbi:hypothetical protein M513_12407 [Trichuris suis]|uniref:DUF4371 domain-containing protein n=1 Tax=Trichuris suis TaxID=68888 RepID=A0A085LP01_9BILA|nr:hypothetical protein M513_12407 [Trichuris suis]